MYLAKYMRVLVRSRTGERKKEKEAGDENLGTLWEAWRHVGSQGIHNTTPSPFEISSRDWIGRRSAAKGSSSSCSWGGIEGLQGLSRAREFAVISGVPCRIVGPASLLDAKLEKVLAAAVEARIEDSLDFILFVGGVFGGYYRIW